MKTTANATVDHLSKYLALRIALEEALEPGPEAPALEDVSEKQYTIYITTAGGAFTVSGAGKQQPGECCFSFPTSVSICILVWLWVALPRPLGLWVVDAPWRRVED